MRNLCLITLCFIIFPILQDKHILKSNIILNDKTAKIMQKLNQNILNVNHFTFFYKYKFKKKYSI